MIGLAATRDADALLTGDADCVCYAADSMGREDEVVNDCIAMLRAGKNVVNVSDAALVYPKAKGADVYNRLHEACLAGNASFYTNGGDPGWAGFGLALAPLTIAQQVRSIRLFEISNCGPWNNPQPGLYGFGHPDTSSSMIVMPGVTAGIWGPTVAMLADALGVTGVLTYLDLPRTVRAACSEFRHVPPAIGWSCRATAAVSATATPR